MMLVYSGTGYGKKAEAALAGHGCRVVNFESLADSNVDWPDLAAGLTEIVAREPHPLMDHQKDALEAVSAGLDGRGRGQLIMACGTGKTLTALRIAEQMAGAGGLILYAVPSLSLMRQSIRHWSEQRMIEHGYVGVCSDTSVSHGKTDIPIMEMEVGVSTDPARIAPAMRRDPSKMVVVFTTYQSMEAVEAAQKAAGSEFDLVLCDEAHRTTGVERGSSFTIVHDDEKIRARRRLYMTATPKIYRPAAKTKAAQDDIVLYSMDDDSAVSRGVFGQVLYRLGFSDAIDMKRLVDYEVVVLGVAEEYGGRALQSMLNTTTDEGDVNLTDAAKMVGLYNVMESPDRDVRPLQTAIAYTNRISDSRRFAKNFEAIAGGGQFRCGAKSVDGTQISTERDNAVQWLRDSHMDADECRVVANARCLSEGVDVPSLDAVVFLNPKDSEIDIIQAVGRVMRTHPDKKRGYVIMPIGIPPGAKPESILDDKKSFSVVWKVLRALRSHDCRMDVEVNTVDLKKRLPKNLRFIGIGPKGERRESAEGDESFPLGGLDVPAGALYSQIVDEVGDRQYFDRWTRDVADVVSKMQEAHQPSGVRRARQGTV